MNRSRSAWRRVALCVAAYAVGLFYVQFGWEMAGVALALVCLWWRASSQAPAQQASVEPNTIEGPGLSFELQQKVLELRVREIEWRDTVRRLEEEGRSKDHFLSAISHELRTPLTSIRAYSEMLADFCGDETPEVRDNFLRIIVQESERLTRLINDLLDLARMESGAESFHPERIDLAAVLRRCFDSLGGLALEKMVTFDLDCQDGPVMVDGEPDRLQQAVTNLLANALRFSPSSAAVQVRLSYGEHRWIVTIRDHGPGIAEDQALRVFERFVQVGDEESRRMGTGLGLAITKEIVDRHGGQIDCGNHPDGGAVFEISLPCKSAEQVAVSDALDSRSPAAIGDSQPVGTQQTD